METSDPTAKQTVELDGTGPDPDRVRQLGRRAVQALRAAEVHVRKDAEDVRAQQDQLAQERERLAANESRLAEQHRDFELRLAEVAKMTADVDASRKQLEDEAAALVQRQGEWKTGEARLAEQKKRQTAAAQALAEREAALNQCEREFEARIQTLEPRKRELDQQEEELTARNRQLEEQVSELDETRRSLAAMQAQLNRDHQEIAIQRDELLQKLGNLTRIATSPVEGVGVAGQPIPVQAKPLSLPKPAVARAVDQFRKLRRDSKRKTVGV